MASQIVLKLHGELLWALASQIVLKLRGELCGHSGFVGGGWGKACTSYLMYGELLINA
jgi:hypothetical protein